MREVNTKIYEILKIPGPEEVGDSLSQVITDNIVQKAQTGEASDVDIDVSGLLDKKADIIHNTDKASKKKVIRAGGARTRTRPAKKVSRKKKVPTSRKRVQAPKVAEEKPKSNIITLVIIAVVAVIFLLKFELI